MNRMKLTLLFMLAILIVPHTLLSAQDSEDREFYNELLGLENSELLSTPQMGDYVIYESFFGNNEIIITIVFLGKRDFFFKTFNKNNYESCEFKTTLIEEDGEYKMSGLALISGDIDSEDLKLALMESLYMFNARKDINTSKFPDAINTSVDWEVLNVRVQYNFRSWIPIVNMYKRTNTEKVKNSMRLIRFGRMFKDREDEVLDFTGLDSSFDNSPSYDLNELPMNPTAYDGINIPLDLNWTTSKSGNTSEILFDDQRYSFLNIQTVPSDNIDESSYMFLNKLIVNNKKYILPESVEFFDFKGTPTLKYVIYDEESLNKSINIIMLYNRGEYTSILSFSSYLNFYNDNKVYFNKILF